MFWAMISKKGGNTLWATDLERNKSSASLYSAHENSIVTPQNRQTDDKNSSTAGNGVSKGASPQHVR
jgi:hypothetical protein